MSCEWFYGRWKDLVEIKYGKSLKYYRDSSGTVPVFGTNGHIGWTEKPLCSFPSVIVGRKGAYRGIHFSACPFYVIDTAFFVAPKKNINIKWAYYNLSLQDINSLDSGSAIPSTSKEDFYSLPVSMPPRFIQDGIVRVLNSLEEKITLNTQINQTLEQMAQALFKSWFVDFDPVIDNALEAGNPIPEPLAERAARRQAMWAADNEAAPERLPAETRRLFPDRFEEDEALGWVPAGWSSGCISDISEINAKSWTAKNSPPSVEYVDLANTKNGVIEETACFGFDEAPSRARRVLSPGDTIVGTVRPGNRSYALIGEAHGQLTGSTGFAVLTPKSKELVEFVYLAITRDEVIEEFARLADGGAYPAIKPSVVTEVKIVIPGYSVLLCFNKLLAPMFTKRQSNFCDNYTLKKLRDTLLPKLLSGELQLPDAEAAVDAALEAETA